MSEIRVWRGWRASRLNTAHGWARFQQDLRATFVPATWQVMRRHGLQCYIPSLLDGTHASGAPDEVALLFYKDVPGYEGHASTVAGRSYAVMHQALFNFDASVGPSSASDWAESTKGTSASAKPQWRQPASGGAGLSNAQHGLTFAALSHPHALDVHAVFEALGPQENEAVVLCEPTFTLMWVAAAVPIDTYTFAKQVLASLPGTGRIAIHGARGISLAVDYFAKFDAVGFEPDQTLRFA